MSKGRNLQLYMRIINIHGIKDYLMNQLEKYNGVGCFIEYY